MAVVGGEGFDRAENNEVLQIVAHKFERDIKIYLCLILI